LIPDHSEINGNKKANREAYHLTTDHFSPKYEHINVLTKRNKYTTCFLRQMAKTKHKTKFNKKNHIHIFLKRKDVKRNHYKSPSNRAHIYNAQPPRGQNDQPTCESCGVYCTVKHILTECQNIEDSRNKHHTPQQLLEEALQSDFKLNINIINFLKNIDINKNK